MRRQVLVRLTLVAAMTALMLVVGVSRAGAQAGPTGFVVRHSVTIAAPAARVYDVLTKQVGAWWNPDHTFSGDSRNMSIDLRPGGCFCETLAGGGFVEHARVVHLAPGAMFRVVGALGPLQESGAAGSLTWTLKSGAAGSTTVQMTYSVGGFIGGPFDAIAPAVQSVLAEQLERMKRLIETGKPAAPPAAQP